MWDLASGRHQQRVDLGAEQQMALELRPAHDPSRAYGFVGVVVSTADLSASIWTWYRDGDSRAAKKVIEIPAEPASEDQLPPALRPFGAVPLLVTDIDLSVTTASCTCRAGARGSSASTTCGTRSTLA